MDASRVHASRLNRSKLLELMDSPLDPHETFEKDRWPAIVKFVADWLDGEDESIAGIIRLGHWLEEMTID